MSGSPQLTEIARTTLPGQASNVGRARHFVANLLGQDWPRLDDVLTLTSELASNAIRHTASGDGGHFHVAVATSAARSHVRVQVADQGGASVPRLAEARDDPDLLTGGRGLGIVDVLADRWGHEGDELGRVVWFEITAKNDGRCMTVIAPLRGTRTLPPCYPSPRHDNERTRR